MSLDSGSRLGAYDIGSPLGAGGMGEVYRARDTKLGRDVAIKILPASFAKDPDRVARFQREAQILAALNHPHIAAIYGLEESGATQFLVLELVEGETLDARLKPRAPSDGAKTADGARGFSRAGLEVPEALAIARQVADALEAAHEKGIIHRDLKPANIALTADNQVKVLDFGLAKALEAGSLSELSHSPTLTFAATQAGVILGTAAYMSPEQAKGRLADKRTDIWAFGCVLFEMLTGRRAFEGEDVTDTIAAVVRGEPDWNALPPDVPEHIRALIKRCLLKDRKERLGDVALVKFFLDGLPGVGPVAIPPPIAPVVATRTRSRLTMTALATAVVVLTAITGWLANRVWFAPAPRVSRFSIVPPQNQPLVVSTNDRQIAISPDGSQVVYVGGSDALLFVRPIDQLDPSPLRGFSGVRAPFMSPDGHWVGFFVGTELRKVSITGGPSVTLCRLVSPPRGASWGADDTIMFASVDGTTGIMRVAAGGGEAQVLTKPDQQRNEQDHFWPSWLPRNRGVLFTITSNAGPELAQVAVLDLKTQKTKTLIRGGSHAEYVSTGHLIYAAQGTLRAVRFDLDRLEVVGDPVPVLDQVVMTPSGAADFAVSLTGTLVYVPGSVIGAEGNRSLVWINRQGREESIPAPPHAYRYLRLSPDGKRVAVDAVDQEADIWIWDLAGKISTRFTFGPALDGYPVWTPDGKRIAFASNREGANDIFWQAADGTGSIERLMKNTAPHFPESFSPDGTQLVVRRSGGTTAVDIGTISLTGERRIATLVQTSFPEFNADVSPDGRWMAYQANEPGRFEVYVRPFPNVDDGRWQISTAGGSSPVWSRNGRELFYMDLTGRIMSVPVQTTPAFSRGNPTPISDTRLYVNFGARTFDVSPDGQRFIAVSDRTPGDRNPAPSSIVVVEHWFEDLKARVPIKD